MTTLHMIIESRDAQVLQQKRKVKICFYVFFPKGGISRYTNELAANINKLLGGEVLVACPPDYQWQDSNQYRVWNRLMQLYHPFPLLRKMRFLVAQFVNPQRAIRMAKEEGAEIIHFSNINPLSYPLWKKQAKKANLKLVISVHDIERRKGILNKEWEANQLKNMYRAADALLVHSEYQATKLVEFAGVRRKDIYIVPHGPYAYRPATKSKEEVYRNLNIPVEKQTALFFGQVRDDKNLHRLLEALQRMVNRPHLIVAGRGAARHKGITYYRSLAERLELLKDVTFIDKYILDEDVGNLFFACDWVALPYLNSFTSQSGVLNVASYFEKPVLVSSAPVLSETVKNCDVGVACDGDSVEAIVKGIIEITDRLNNGYEHQFEKYKDLFSWQENARISIDIYQKILGDRKEAPDSK